MVLIRVLSDAHPFGAAFGCPNRRCRLVMAGEAEVDEPLAVKTTRHSFQYLDAPLAIFDQFVVG